MVKSSLSMIQTPLNESTEKTGARDAQCPFVFASHLPTLHNDDNQNNHGNIDPSTFHK